MPRKRKTHTTTFKAQVALAALTGDKTVNELASPHAVPPTRIHAGKKQRLASAEDLFGHGGKADATDHETRAAQLSEQIGRLKRELDWVKKNLPASAEAKRALVEIRPSQLSLGRPCQRLDLARSSFDRETATETVENVRLRRLKAEATDRRTVYRSAGLWQSADGSERPHQALG